MELSDTNSNCSNTHGSTGKHFGLAGQSLATPTTGRGESGQVPIIISCLTCQEFLGVLSGFNSVRLPFSTLVRKLTSCVSMLYYYTHAQLCSHPLS